MRRTAFGLASGLWLAATGSAFAGELVLPIPGGQVRAPLTSLAELRWQRVVPQQYDFSCGSAALATLLTHHYDRPVTEAVVFTTMYEQGDPLLIEQQGFSLLDLRNFLGQVGLRADGFRLDIDKLAEIGVPMITMIDLAGFHHYVLIKGVRGDYVLIGDPALGLIALSRADFEPIWSGVALAVRDELERGRETFNHPNDWAIRPEAPAVGIKARAATGTFRLHLPARTEY